MPSADMFMTNTLAFLETDSTQRRCTGAAGRHPLLLVTNVGANAVRVGVKGSTLAAVGTATQSDGQCDLAPAAQVFLTESFEYVSTSDSSLRVEALP